MSKFLSNNESALFGRSVDDYLLYEGGLFTEQETHEFEDKYVVEISVPGFKPEDLGLIAENDTLLLRGFEITKEQKLFWTSITKIPIFQRSLVLPTNVAINTISARYLSGVVQIICPKQLIPFGHYKNHYLVQSRKIKIIDSRLKPNIFVRIMRRMGFAL